MLRSRALRSEEVIAWSGTWNSAFSKERGHVAAPQHSSVGDADVDDSPAPAPDLKTASKSLLPEAWVPSVQ